MKMRNTNNNHDIEGGNSDTKFVLDDDVDDDFVDDDGGDDNGDNIDDDDI